MADAGDDVRRREGGLLDLGEVVLRVAIELQDAHLDQREFAMRPDLGQVERVEAGLPRLLIGHHLDAETPFREVTCLDAVEQVFLGALAAATDHVRGLGIGPVFVPLQGLEVELDPDALVGRIDQAVGVRTVAVDVAHASRQPAVGHQDGHLVQALRRQRPEVPGGGI
ncbi:hypothetical protein D9M71_578060 [compost metagenome]